MTAPGGTGPGRPVRFGVQLQAQRTTWREYEAALAAVEELGFDTVFTFDHLLPVDGPDDGSCFETLTTLAAMAARTQRVRIGSLCEGVMYRDPATLAKAAAMVDQISDGRLEFTLGPAWAEREFRTYGLHFAPPGERLRRLDEALTIIKRLWTEPRTTFEGRYYSVFDAPCEPKPVQRPHPPIMIGGGRAGTMRLTAKHADAWNGIGSATFCADPELAIAPTHDKAEELAERVSAGHSRRLEDGRGLWVLGTPDEVREQVGAYVRVGVSHLIFAVPFPFQRGGLELFAREVAPAFR
jgi:alkanesulfonate monooxygenase SsuD/methylene tetrahydromethanopterin reductase-like flavin-dependent oxidoreductase (luciferase family)